MNGVFYGPISKNPPSWRDQGMLSVKLSELVPVLPPKSDAMAATKRSTRFIGFDLLVEGASFVIF